MLGSSSRSPRHLWHEPLQQYLMQYNDAPQGSPTSRVAGMVRKEGRTVLRRCGGLASSVRTVTHRISAGIHSHHRRHSLNQSMAFDVAEFSCGKAVDSELPPLEFGFVRKEGLTGLTAKRIPMQYFAGGYPGSGAADERRGGVRRPSPLALLVEACASTKDFTVFENPVIEAIMRYKWEHFGWRAPAIMHSSCSHHALIIGVRLAPPQTR